MDIRHYAECQKGIQTRNDQILNVIFVEIVTSLSTDFWEINKDLSLDISKPITAGDDPRKYDLLPLQTRLICTLSVIYY
jgi:hypothetical protein